MLYPHAEQEFGPWGYIDKTGRTVIPLQFTSAQSFSEGLAAVAVQSTDGRAAKKYGYIDRTGTLVIPAEYTQVKPAFRNGRAAVKLGNWGLIDRGGKLIVPPFTYTYIDSFNDDRA